MDSLSWIEPPDPAPRGEAGFSRRFAPRPASPLRGTGSASRVVKFSQLLVNFLENSDFIFTSFFLHFYSNLHKPRRFRRVREIFGGRAHIEKAKGTDLENQAYCSKGSDIWTSGQPCTQGNRTDLQEVVSLIEGGERDFKAVALQCPTAFIKYFKGIREYLRIYHPITERDFATECYYLWGPPGSGKSRRALQEAQNHGGAIYYKPRGDWWDGYEQQPNVIIDDFYGWIKYDEMLKICDRYPYRVPVKFGFEVFNSKRIWITSNSPLEVAYRFPGYDCKALKRRMTKIEEIN